MRKINSEMGIEETTCRVGQRVEELDGIMKETPSVVDAGEPGYFQHVGPKHPLPKALDFRHLGVKAVTANIKTISLVALGASQTTYLVALLKDKRTDSMLQQLLGCSQSRRASSHDDDREFVACDFRKGLRGARGRIGQFLASSCLTFCSAATATSIIRASGSRVVNDCSTRLGFTTNQ